MENELHQVNTDLSQQHPVAALTAAKPWPWRPQDAVSKRHCTTLEAVAVAVAMGAQCCILTHFSARYPKAPVFGSGAAPRDDAAEDCCVAPGTLPLPQLPAVASDLAARARKFPPPEVKKTKPADWLCPACQAVVYGSRAVCFRCTAPRPAADMLVAAPPASLPTRPGDPGTVGGLGAPAIRCGLGMLLQGRSECLLPQVSCHRPRRRSSACSDTTMSAQRCVTPASRPFYGICRRHPAAERAQCGAN